LSSSTNLAAQAHAATSAACNTSPPSQHGDVGRIAPEQPVEVLDDGEWIEGFVYYRQQLEDGWWYHVRVYHHRARAAAVRVLPGSGAQAGMSDDQSSIPSIVTLPPASGNRLRNALNAALIASVVPSTTRLDTTTPSSASVARELDPSRGTLDR
jgi:hypothetical protein